MLFTDVHTEQMVWGMAMLETLVATGQQAGHSVPNQHLAKSKQNRSPGTT